ncbi:MAG TPA: hypothetical protein VII43_06535 [Opitutaceae bacterium]
MELNLQPRAIVCAVSGRPFAEGDRVASLLVRSDAGDVARIDALEAESSALAPEGFVACRWVQVFKPRPKDENPERTLKLGADALFQTLADPATVRTPETDRLVRFLALLLERKRLLRLRGRTSDGERELYEHAGSRQMFEVPSIELTPEFFAAVREQLTVLVGEPRAAPAGAP